MVSVAPHVRLDSALVAGQYILPVPLSELTEIKLSYSSEFAITLLISNSSLLEIFYGEIHALELVEQTDVS